MVEDRPQPLSDQVRQRMQAQARAGTAPELMLRRILFSKGMRYRIGLKVPGIARRTIDVAFPKQRLAIFVDGCFWHRCPVHHVPPKNNAAWWARKLQANVDRDITTTDVLESQGWTVMRFWEHQAMEEAADEIETLVRHQREWPS